MSLILKLLARRGFVFREGTDWWMPYWKSLLHLTTDGSPLEPHDRLVFREYHALLMYKLQRHQEIDRHIEELAFLPALAPMVARLQCLRGISLHSAMVLTTEILDWRRFERPAQLACYLKRPQIAVVAVARELVWLPVGGDARASAGRSVREYDGVMVGRAASRLGGVPICEHSRPRYAVRAVRSSYGIPGPRMSQLPTNPLLGTVPMRIGNRPISAGPTVDACSRSRHTMTTTIFT